jgi:putative autoinducer-2 (AI-2) aldolase
MAYRAITEGAAGVDMGRNIFQSEHPAAMIQAVSAIVHQQAKPRTAYDHYLKAGPGRDQHEEEER